jgi:thiol:disulfide interchange protein DsbD
MRFVLPIITFILFPLLLSAQILEPVKWTFEVSSKTVKSGEEIELIFKAHIDDNWYLFSNDFDPDCGPLLTEVQFSDIKNFQVSGPLVPIKSLPKYDETFGCDVKIFKKTGEFRQKIKVTGKPLKISGAVKGQVCSDLDFKCVSFDKEFLFEDFNVSGAAATPKKENQSEQKTRISPSGHKPDEAKNITNNSDTTKNEIVKASDSQYGKNKGPVIDPSILKGAPSYGNDSFWSLLILAFVAGLTSLITPCVFPMIPMTVTFFLKDTQSRRQGIKKAIIFGLSIIVLYSSAGTLFAFILGPEGLNALATNWVLNLFIFFVFIIFALSFFGLFEINAPHQLVNKIDRQAEKGGLLGVFFMAFTLVLISFSCTVPIVGSVLALSAGGQILKPILMMFSYSLAFALPFAFFAFFPEVIKSMPKSGGWLNAVKVTLGFLELALALKFFSIADQAYHWGHH